VTSALALMAGAAPPLKRTVSPLSASSPSAVTVAADAVRTSSDPAWSFKTSVVRISTPAPPFSTTMTELSAATCFSRSSSRWLWRPGPAVAGPDHTCFRKVGTRLAQSISKVSLAARLRLRDGVVSEARVAYGSVAPTPVRCPSAEAALLGKPVDAAVADRVERDIRPIDDVRRTAAYRLRVAPDGDWVLDSMSYEGVMEGVTEGAASAPEDDGLNTLSRCPNGDETDSNADDFALGSPTLGATNDCDGPGRCPADSLGPRANRPFESAIRAAPRAGQAGIEYDGR